MPSARMPLPVRSTTSGMDSMRRYVRRGSKGIALIDISGDNPRLCYVFDVSDTGGRKNFIPVWRWYYREE